jgi:RIO-like serine/threonine protein kinase
MQIYDENLYYTKYGIELNEYKIHQFVYNLQIVNIPKIVHYDKQTKTMVMNKINGLSFSDEFGELPEDISNAIFERIRDVIKILVLHNIQYVDITGYNFILDKNNILWIIDFEHATYNDRITDDFILRFICGENSWNPEFA